MSETQDDDTAEQGETSSLSVTTYDQLTSKIATEGSYIIGSSDYSVAFSSHPSPDQVEGDSASLAAISMTLTNRFATLSTLITRDTLDAVGSLVALAETIPLHSQKIYGASAEIQYIEHEIKTHLGIDPNAVINQAIAAGFPDEGFAEKVSEECADDEWRAQHLRTIFDCLIEYRGIQCSIRSFGRDQSVREVFPSLDDLTALMDHHFTQGFLLARLISEYFIRYEIGPLAEKGLAVTCSPKLPSV